METKQENQDWLESDDEEDRLSHFEDLNLGLSFPETDDAISDEEDELLLILHLNQH